MNIWTVANQKGGVGKTTTALALAGLAAEAKCRVLLVDMDPHGSLTSFFHLNPDTQKLSTYSLFEHAADLNEMLVRRCVCETNQPQLSLLPASTALMSIDRQPLGADGMGQVLKKALALISNAFDLIIIDGPPMAGILLVNAICSADNIIMPVQTDYLALQGLQRMLNTLMAMKSASAPSWKVPPYLVVPTMHDRRTHASASVLQRLRDEFNSFIKDRSGRPDVNMQTGSVWHSQIPIDTKIRDAMESATLPHKLQQESTAMTAYRVLYSELERCGTVNSSQGNLV